MQGVPNGITPDNVALNHIEDDIAPEASAKRGELSD